MKKIVFLTLILALSFICNAEDFLKITGKVTDKQTKMPIPIAEIYISGCGFGTVTNEFGEFIFKVPLIYKNDTLKISHIGYSSFTKVLDNFNENIELNVELQINPVILMDVNVYPEKVEDILNKALLQIPVNYDTQPVNLKGFYRETSNLKSYDNIIDLTGYELNEAVFDVYSAPYPKDISSNSADSKIKLIAWRNESRIKDTLHNSFNGIFPNTTLNFDILKNIKNSFLLDIMEHIDPLKLRI
jgi:hypothetical protein